MLPEENTRYNCAMAKYPVFLEMTGRRVVVIGGGVVAVRKARSLLEAGARLVVVAEKVSEVLAELCAGHGAELIKSKYSKEYLSKATMAIAATDDRQLNGRVYRDCQELEILCNVVDAPELCDFFVPAVVKRGDLQVSVCTEGYCPAYAGHLRKKLEKVITEKHGQFLAELEKIRDHIMDEVASPAERKAVLGELVDDKSFAYFRRSGPAAWRRKARETIESHTVKT